MTTAATAGKTFCILPWMHLTVMPEGSAKICCVAAASIQSDGVPASLQSQPLETIWNSPYMRAVRRDMVAGRYVGDCAHCYRVEKHGGVSRRLLSNARWAAELGPLYDALVEQSQLDDYTVGEMPLYYQLMPGNLCNLKCRMCFPVFSSQIARDPIQSRWAPPLFDGTVSEAAMPDWTRGRLALTPQAVPGVSLDGFHTLEGADGRQFRWTNGNATLTVALPRGIRAESLRVRLRRGAGRGRPLRILVNGVVVHEGPAPRRSLLWRGGWERTFAVPPSGDAAPLTVRLESGTFRPGDDARDLGVAVELVELAWTGVAEQEERRTPAGRVPVGPWYRDDAWVREVLLQNADRLRGLYFTGGEPMIEKQVEGILQHLIERGAAGNVVLECNTNCTVLRDAMLEKLLQFRRVHLGLSIDAAGAVYEYIRYPSKWANVRRNVERLVALSGERLALAGGIVLQVYNALNLVDVLEFFDALQIPFQVEIATVPWFLHVGVLPGRVRAVAVERLRAYADRTARPQQRTHVLSLAQQVEQVKDQCTPEALRTLMLFTNDLDAGRGQSVRAVHGELLELLRGEGFDWTDERSAAAAA